MIDISVLYCGLETPSTPHRYGRKITQIDPPEHQRMKQAKSAKERRPIVVWNLTRTCNLKCQHCYTASEAKSYPGELTTAQCKEALDDLTRATEILPDYALIYVKRARAYKSLGNFRKALIDMEHALVLEPGRAEALEEEILRLRENTSDTK